MDPRVYFMLVPLQCIYTYPPTPLGVKQVCDITAPSCLVPSPPPHFGRPKMVVKSPHLRTRGSDRRLSKYLSWKPQNVGAMLRTVHIPSHAGLVKPSILHRRSCKNRDPPRSVTPTVYHSPAPANPPHFETSLGALRPYRNW